jgi:hypothetical protein
MAAGVSSSSSSSSSNICSKFFLNATRFHCRSNTSAGGALGAVQEEHVAQEHSDRRGRP